MSSIMNASGAKRKERYQGLRRYIMYSMSRRIRSLHCVSSTSTEENSTGIWYHSATTVTTERTRGWSTRRWSRWMKNDGRRRDKGWGSCYVYGIRIQESNNIWICEAVRGEGTQGPAVTDSLCWTMWMECIPKNFLQRYPRYPLYPKSVGDAYNG